MFMSFSIRAYDIEVTDIARMAQAATDQKSTVPSCSNISVNYAMLRFSNYLIAGLNEDKHCLCNILNRRATISFSSFTNFNQQTMPR